jgi:tetratricopeptide (TPR) repeat protein
MLPGAGVALSDWHGPRMGRRRRARFIGRWLVGQCLAAGVLASCQMAWAADEPGPVAPEAAPEQSPEAPPSAERPAASPASEAPASDTPAEPGAATAEDREAAAYEAFNRGADLYEQRRFEESLAEYERAYELSPSYPVLYNIGGLSLQLERWARARRAFELYLKLGGAELAPERVAEIKRTLDELKARTGTLTLNMNVPPDQVKIDSSPVEVLEISGLVVDPGERVLYVSKPGFRPLELTVHVNRGERTQVLVQLFPDAPPNVRSQSDPLEPVPAPVVDRGIDPRWLAWGITGALAVGWGTTALLAIKARHDRDSIEQPGTPPEDIEDAQQLHKTLAIVSDVLLVSTLASAGVAAYFTWWSDDTTPAPQAHSGTPPRVSHEGWMMGVSGRF